MNMKTAKWTAKPNRPGQTAGWTLLRDGVPLIRLGRVIETNPGYLTLEEFAATAHEIADRLSGRTGPPAAPGYEQPYDPERCLNCGGFHGLGLPCPDLVPR